jgi:hypothetical protein
MDDVRVVEQAKREREREREREEQRTPQNATD